MSHQLNPTPHHLAAALVLGMHRSGTSFLSSFIQSLGVHMGDVLVGPRMGNPRGHFEDEEVLGFHQDLIQRHSGNSGRVFDDGMMAQSPLKFDPTTEDTDRARAIIEQRRALGKVWGWKEPRTSLFADFWLDLLPEARPVLIFRHPLEVHFSMLRRQHWDLLLFPGQVCTAYAVYQASVQRVLKQRPADFLILNANESFADLAKLEQLLCDHLQLKPSTKSRAQFHAEEFRSLHISDAMHRTFALICPSAAASFDQLQQQANIPGKLTPRPDDSWWEQLHDFLAPILTPLPEAARAAFIPMLEGCGLGQSADKIARLRSRMNEEMADKIRKTDEWNHKARKIHEENRTLFEEKEKLGKQFAAQQQFLEQQETIHNDIMEKQKAYIAELEEKVGKIWDDLVRVGKDWENKMERITALEAQLAERNPPV